MVQYVFPEWLEEVEEFKYGRRSRSPNERKPKGQLRGRKSPLSPRNKSPRGDTQNRRSPSPRNVSPRSIQNPSPSSSRRMSSILRPKST